MECSPRTTTAIVGAATAAAGVACGAATVAHLATEHRSSLSVLFSGVSPLVLSGFLPVDGYGGDVRVEDGDHGGARFRVELPRPDESADVERE
jgi:hypothetical protein